MKKFYNFLNILLWVIVGNFIGSSIWKYYDYKKYTSLYEMQSAPWYLSIEINAIFTITCIIVILIAMKLIKNK